MELLDRALGAVGRMKFGPGVLGRLGTTVSVVVVVLGVLGWAVRSSGAEPVLTIAAMIFALAALLIIGGFLYAHFHPELSALESSHYTRIATQRAASNTVPVEYQARRANLVGNPEIIDAIAHQKGEVRDV